MPQAPKRETDYHRQSPDTSLRTEKDREEVRTIQSEAREANYQAPQDLPTQTVASETVRAGKEKPFNVTVVGQEAYLEIGDARVKINREQAQQLSKQMRRIAAATY